MRLHLASFAISFTTLCSLIILILTVWTRLSSTFGGEFMSAFRSIHPNPYGAGDTDLTTLQTALGALFDLFYAATDSLVFSLGFGSLYNFLVSRTERKNPE